MRMTKMAIVAIGMAALFVAPGLLATQAKADSTVTYVAMPPISKRTDFYGGAVIPVKFMLLDGNGQPISDAQATIWVNGAPGTSAGHANMGNTFRFDMKSMTYIYNLNTKPLPAGPGSPPSTITVMVVSGTTTLTENFVVTLD